MAEPFSLRSLFQLTKRVNDDPGLIEDDWRQAFYQFFALTPIQREALGSLDEKDNDAARQELQAAVRHAAQEVRKGGSIKFRVSQDLLAGKRVLRLELTRAGAGGGDDETLPPDGDLALVCCCADCRCWHFCWKRPNPCLNC